MYVCNTFRMSTHIYSNTHIRVSVGVYVYDIRVYMIFAFLCFYSEIIGLLEKNIIKIPCFSRDFFPLPIFRKISFRVIINEPFSLILFNHYKVKWMQVGINLVSRIKRKSSGHEEGKLVSWLLAILLWVEVINTGLMKQTPARLSKH